MTFSNLPEEVCVQVAQHAQYSDLVALCRVSKAFQPAGEVRLYAEAIFHDPQRTYHVCRSVMLRGGRRGAYVRCFGFLEDSRHPLGAPLPHQFWQTMQAALAVMINLDVLWLGDPALRNTWILNPSLLKFKLREVHLRVAWDAHVVNFLHTQPQLRFLQAIDSLEDGPLSPILPDKLQSLDTFEGPLLVAAELFACPITRMQITVDAETAPILSNFLMDLSKAKVPLNSLSILFIPEIFFIETLQLISTSSLTPTLRHLGVLPLPNHNRTKVHECLTHFVRLQTIELEVAHWDPGPIEPFQRMLAAELRVYCPTVNRVVFWIGHHRFLWFCEDNEWTHEHESGRHSYHETLWQLS